MSEDEGDDDDVGESVKVGKSCLKCGCNGGTRAR